MRTSCQMERLRPESSPGSFGSQRRRPWPPRATAAEQYGDGAVIGAGAETNGEMLSCREEPVNGYGQERGRSQENNIMPINMEIVMK
uniref:Uncharacterized protein n=1 Tax=Oryza punctata TaxID=4537 RepID=A0A0E0LW33_ORYPU